MNTVFRAKILKRFFDQLHIGFNIRDVNSGYYLVVFTRASKATGHIWLGLINRRDSTQNIYRGITLDGLRTAIVTDHKDDYYEVARWYPITRHYYQYLLTCPELELGKESYYASTNQNCTTWTRERAKSINVDITPSGMRNSIHDLASKMGITVNRKKQNVQNGGDIPRAWQQLNVEAYNENDLKVHIADKYKEYLKQKRMWPFAENYLYR